MNEKTGHFYTFGPFRLDSRECLLVLDGKPVALAPKAFEVLLVLVENAGHLVDKDDLMKRLWPGTFVEEANVTKHVSLLRSRLRERGPCVGIRHRGLWRSSEQGGGADQAGCRLRYPD